MFEAVPTVKKRRKLISGVICCGIDKAVVVFICCNELDPGGRGCWEASVGIMSRERGRAAPGDVQERGEGIFGELCSSSAACLDALSPDSSCAHEV